MNLILINSNENDSFAAVYAGDQFRVVRSSEFAGNIERPGRSPGKLINCLLKLRDDFEFENTDAISVTIGPGSFTGIRVGLALAKGIAGAIQKPLIPIPNFDLLFERITNRIKSKTYCILIPAKKPEYYFSIFENSAQVGHGCSSIEEIMRILKENTVIAGDFYNVSMQKHHYFEYLNLSNSGIREEAAMLELSKKSFLEGKQLKPEQIMPIYVKDFAVKNVPDK